MAIEPTSKPTVKMQYRGHFKGTQKIVQLPIPLLSTSQKLEQTLVFERAATSHGPAFCQVPLEWVGILLDVGGYWSVAEPLTADLTAKIASAKEATAARMKKFSLENELVET